MHSAVLIFSLLFTVISAYQAICDADRYGRPSTADCATALSKYPQDKDVRYFVEQQMRNPSPQAKWQAFQDPRPSFQLRTIVQLPKWISYGTCNVAIYSYRHRSQLNPAPATTWQAIQQFGQHLGHSCIARQQGGAITVMDDHNTPGLGLYMWEDGANFEFVVNQEMGDQFPYGMDPTITNELLQNAAFNETLPAELRVGGGVRNGTGTGSVGTAGFVGDLSAK